MKPFFINHNLLYGNLPSYNGDMHEFMLPVAGNVGNSYITFALMKEFGVHECEGIQSVYDLRDDDVDILANKINDEFTHVVLILQDQIRISESYGYKLPYKAIIKLLNKCNKPILCAGLGSNSLDINDKKFINKLDPDLVWFLNELSLLVKEIGIRGEYTKELLNRLGVSNCTVIGCPTYYESGENRKLVNRPVNKIMSTSAWESSECEHIILDKIIQDEYENDFFELFYTGNIPNRLKNNYDFFNKAVKNNYHFFFSIADWKRFVSEFDLSIGIRVHGSILSLNSGTIPICTNKDSRSNEMCSCLNIPYHPGGFKNYNELIDFRNSIDVEYINENYRVLYDKYVDFWKRQDVDIIKQPCNDYDVIKQPSITFPAVNAKEIALKALRGNIVRIIAGVVLGKVQSYIDLREDERNKQALRHKIAKEALLTIFDKAVSK